MSDYHEHVAGDKHSHAFNGPHSHGGVSALRTPRSRPVAAPDPEESGLPSADYWLTMLVAHAERVHGCEHTGQLRAALGVAAPPARRAVGDLDAETLAVIFDMARETLASHDRYDARGWLMAKIPHEAEVRARLTEGAPPHE